MESTNTTTKIKSLNIVHNVMKHEKNCKRTSPRPSEQSTGCNQTSKVTNSRAVTSEAPTWLYEAMKTDTISSIYCTVWQNIFAIAWVHCQGASADDMIVVADDIVAADDTNSSRAVS
jgi:hypothetical protein